MTGRSLVSLDRSKVRSLPGVGDKKLEVLEEAGINTILDLLTHYPRRWIDRTTQASIREVKDGEIGTLVATVKRVNAFRPRQGRTVVNIDVFDGSGYLTCTFFNQPWRAKQLPVGTEVVVSGKVDRFRGKRQMANPVVDLVGNRTGRIVPVYPQSEKFGLTTRDLSDWIEEALDRLTEVHGGLVEPLPVAWRDRLQLVGRDWAMHQIHFPESMGAKESARKRLAFDELLRLQMILVMRKRAIEREATGIRHQVEGALLTHFRHALPFPLTAAQERAIGEISRDLAGPTPCTGCCRATWGRARRSWRWPPCWPPSRAGIRGR